MGRFSFSQHFPFNNTKIYLQNMFGSSVMRSARKLQRQRRVNLNNCELLSWKCEIRFHDVVNQSRCLLNKLNSFSGTQQLSWIIQPLWFLNETSNNRGAVASPCADQRRFLRRFIGRPRRGISFFCLPAAAAAALDFVMNFGSAVILGSINECQLATQSIPVLCAAYQNAKRLELINYWIAAHEFDFWGDFLGLCRRQISE